MKTFEVEKSVEIPCYVRDMTDDDAKLYSIVENLERAELNPMEEVGICNVFKLERYSEIRGEMNGINRNYYNLNQYSNFPYTSRQYLY